MSQALPENLLPFQFQLCDSFPVSNSKNFKIPLHTIGPSQLGSYSSLVRVPKGIQLNILNVKDESIDSIASSQHYSAANVVFIFTEANLACLVFPESAEDAAGINAPSPDT
ncbi:hypothetical protein CEXT_33621 [Caerostris extrusa]|uniref:Uncharacterized protein n=1 Tax=Caerostris extrusa TaxID=172846 RepID=A0AAV4PSK7_CAEEX|nr:hypothetical protein CEXT_33621 [Caerostris extrusa]